MSPKQDQEPSPKLRVLHIVSNRWFSAITDYALTAAEALSPTGSEGSVAVSHVLLPERSVARPVAEARGLSVTTLPGFSPLALPRLYREITAFKPTAIICYEGQETALTRLLLPKLGSEVRVFRFYGRDLRLLKFPEQDSSPKSLLRKAGLKLSTAHLTGVLVPSEVMAEVVAPFFPQHCHRIPIARRLPVATPRSPHSGPPRLVMLGRLDPVKGHREFVAMFKAMLERWPAGTPQPELTIIGQPANVSEEGLNQWLRLYGVDHKVTVDVQRVEDIATRMASFDVGVIFSQGSEVICRVGAEMLMSGLSLMVTDVGALPELNLRANARDVLVVPSLDTDEQEVTVAAMNRFVAETPTESQEERRQRQKFYHRAFSLKLMARRLRRMLAQPHTD